jgi:hypothetical protein
MSYIYSANDFRNENHDVRIYCHSDLGVSRLQVTWNLYSKEIAESSAKHGVRDAIEFVPALKLGALEAHPGRWQSVDCATCGGGSGSSPCAPRDPSSCDVTFF